MVRENYNHEMVIVLNQEKIKITNKEEDKLCYHQRDKSLEKCKKGE